MEYGYTDTAKNSGEARFVRITDIDENGHLKKTGQKFINITQEAKRFLLQKGDLLVARTGATFGKTAIFEEKYPAVFASYLIRLRFNEGDVLPGFFWLFAQSEDYWNQAKKLVTGGGQPQFNANAIKKIEAPVVSVATQKQFIAEAEKEEEILEANIRLMDLMEEKINNVLSEI